MRDVRLQRRKNDKMTTLEGMFARQRILVSRLVIWPLAVAVILATSRWEERVVFEGFLFLTGCMLVAVATIGRLWCSLYICGYKTKQLVTSGPYSLCRNPLYFFSAIGAVGVGFATETLTIPLLLALMFTLFYPTVIRAEEAKLENLHGEAYNAYLSGVPRFWPRSAGLYEPEEYLVAPAKFRHAMIDALWFVWLVGIIELAEALRNAGILPTVVKLY